MGDVVHRRRDEVDRDDVDVPALEADDRRPLGKHAAQALDHLEEVVGPVDLVHLAGLRMAHDDPRPVDAPRHLASPRARASRTRTWCASRGRRTSGPRRTCPRGTGRGSDPRPRSSWCGGRPSPERVGELDRVRVPSTFSGGWSRRPPPCRRWRRDGRSGRRLRAVSRSASETPSSGARDVADHRTMRPSSRAPARDQLLQPGARALADEHVDGALALEQALDQVPADEAGGPGDEVLHTASLIAP